MSSVNPDKLPPDINEMREEALGTVEVKVEEGRLLSLVFLYTWISSIGLLAILTVLIVLAFALGLEMRLIALAFEWGRRLGGG